MLSIGKMNKLTVDRIIDMGAFLESSEGEVLLPKKCLPENLRAGDEINVFVYKDFGERVMASTDRPHAEVGDIAVLPVVDVNDIGAFLDWGMEKDLLLPYRRQLKPVTPGQKCVVKIIIDDKTGRINASSKLGSFLKFNDGSLSAGTEVTALFFDESEIGFTAVVNGEFIALLHRPEATEPINVGMERKVYVKRVRPEGQIDLSLRKVGYEAVVEALPMILEALENSGGFLPLTDKSSPEDIKAQLNLSKKAFKRVVGTLYKEKKIKLEDDGIRLL